MVDRALGAGLQDDGSKFKAVNNRDRNFTPHKLAKRMQQVEESIARYMDALDTADRTQPADLEAKTTRLKDELVKLRKQMRQLRDIGTELRKQPDEQLSLTDPDARSGPEILDLRQNGCDIFVESRCHCVRGIDSFCCDFLVFGEEVQCMTPTSTF